MDLIFDVMNTHRLSSFQGILIEKINDIVYLAISIIRNLMIVEYHRIFGMHRKMIFL